MQPDAREYEEYAELGFDELEFDEIEEAEDADEIEQLVRRVHAALDPGRIVDTAGTGGAPKTFNVSTAAAIIAAAAAGGDIAVAKHGNRSRTGRGYAEVLAALEELAGKRLRNAQIAWEKTFFRRDSRTHDLPPGTCSKHVFRSADSAKSLTK